jgi:ATP-dependent Clp protease ATP-binding subunit ClpA
MFDKYEASSEPLSPYDPTGGIMFERFTDRSREVVTLAHTESYALDHDYIGTEHLLLALMNLQGSVSREALTGSGYEVEALRALLDRGHTTTRHSIPFTPRAKKTLELSLREALQLGHRGIDDHHLLLGILRLGECTALSMLVPDGDDATIVRLRQAVMERIPGTTPIEGMRQAVMERVPGAAPSEQTADNKASLIAAINNHLATMSEAALQRLLDSLG